MRDHGLARREFVRLGASAVVVALLRPATCRAAGAAGALAAAWPDGALAAAPPDGVPLRLAVVLPAPDPALLGVRLGAREAEQAARLFGTTFELAEAAVPATGARLAAVRLAEAGAHAIIGGGTPAAADQLVEAAAQARVPFFNVGVPADSLAEPCAAFAFHLLPDEAMRRDALAAAPAGTPPTARAVGWHPALERFGAAQVNDRFRSAFGAGMGERAWAGWMAVKILFDAAQRAGSSDSRVLVDYLLSERTVFDGHKGLQLSFRPRSRQLRQPVYVATGDGVIAEFPAMAGAREASHAELLDSFGMTGEERCSR